MSPFDPIPAFRGATYSDELQLVHNDTGAVVPFLPAIDSLTWRLFGMGTRCPGWRGWDYGFSGFNGPSLDLLAEVTLALGQGLSITAAGTALWVLPVFPTWLRDPEYRMTLDLVRYGETCRVMDTILQVEN